jgi:hypothetical protein
MRSFNLSLLAQSKVNDVNDVSLGFHPNEKVVRGDTHVQKRSRMNQLQSSQQLVGNHEDSLQRELFVAKVEEFIECWVQTIQDEDIEIALGSIPSKTRYTNYRALPAGVARQL